MEKMKNNIIRGKRDMYKVVNEVDFNSLPNIVLKQLAIVGITNTAQYNNSSYRLVTERLFKYYIEKFIMYFSIFVMFIGLIAGMLGDIKDFDGTNIVFIIVYIFAIVTLVRVYDYYYIEMVEPWALKVEKLSAYELQLMRTDYDNEE